MNTQVPLLPGERSLWEGRPATGLVLRPSEFFLIPFSLLWGGFAIFWNVSVWSIPGAGPDIPFKLFGLPILLAGLYIIAGRFLVDLWLRARTSYCVTDRRVLIRRAFGGTTSLDIKRLPGLGLDERADGSGTIRFGESGGWFRGKNFGLWQPSLDTVPQFFRIDGARSVYQLIERHAHA